MSLPSPAFELILADLYDGVSLKESLSKRGVNRTAFYKYKDNNLEFADQYTRARHAQADLFVEQLVSIADDENIDPARARNMIDVRKWTASKIIPATYGDKLEVNQTVTMDLKGVLSRFIDNPLPARDLENVVNVEVVESHTVSDTSATGCKPVGEDDSNSGDDNKG